MGIAVWTSYIGDSNAMRNDIVELVWAFIMAGMAVRSSYFLVKGIASVRFPFVELLLSEASMHCSLAFFLVRKYYCATMIVVDLKTKIVPIGNIYCQVCHLYGWLL